MPAIEEAEINKYLSKVWWVIISKPFTILPITKWKRKLLAIN